MAAVRIIFTPLFYVYTVLFIIIVETLFCPFPPPYSHIIIALEVASTSAAIPRANSFPPQPTWSARKRPSVPMNKHAYILNLLHFSSTHTLITFTHFLISASTQLSVY